MPEETPDSAPAKVAAEQAPQARLGVTAAGRAASSLLDALARAAWSLGREDPRDEAIRAQMETVRSTLAEALRPGAPLRFEVRPFELVVAGEVVYLARDCERSLAFRLFRDGVRRLTIRPETSWDEMLQLLELLAVQYAGVHRLEEDVVTALHRAGLRHVAIEAEDVDWQGDEAPEPPRLSPRLEAEGGVPEDWQVPALDLEEPAAVAYRAVAAEDLARLLSEEAAGALPENAVRAATRALEAAADPDDPTTLEDVAGLLAEVRDFLLAEGRLAELAGFLSSLRAAPNLDPAQLSPLLTALADRRALELILRSLPQSAEGSPDPLAGLLEQLPAELSGRLVELLEEARGERGRRQTQALAPAGPGAVEKPAPARRVRRAQPETDGELLRACAEGLPEPVQKALDLAPHPDEGVVMEVLGILAAAPPTPAIERTLVRLFESSSSEVRLRAVEILAKNKENAAFAPLVRFVERRAHHSLTTREAETYGQGIARLSPELALPLLRAWVHLGGLLERPLAKPHERLLRWAAVSGLSLLPGTEPADLIRTVADHSDAELRRHCLALLASRAQGASGG